MSQIMNPQFREGGIFFEQYLLKKGPIYICPDQLQSQNKQLKYTLC